MASQSPIHDKSAMSSPIRLRVASESDKKELIFHWNLHQTKAEEFYIKKKAKNWGIKKISSNWSNLFRFWAKFVCARGFFGRFVLYATCMWMCSFCIYVAAHGNVSFILNDEVNENKSENEVIILAFIRFYIFTHSKVSVKNFYIFSDNCAS